MWLSLVVASVLFVGALCSLLLARRSKRLLGNDVVMSASSVAAAVGIHPFKTPLDLFNEMIGGDKTPSNAATTFGQVRG